VPRRSLVYTLALLGALALAHTVHPQTSDVWTNSKISDLRRHGVEGDVSRATSEHMEMANRYLQRVRQLTEKGDLTPRQQAKLDKAYERATSHLEQAIEGAPDWVEPRLYLAALHFQMKTYDQAVACYEGALALDPDNQDVQAYLTTARWYLEHENADEAPGGTDDPRP